METGELVKCQPQCLFIKQILRLKCHHMQTRKAYIHLRCLVCIIPFQLLPWTVWSTCSYWFERNGLQEWGKMYTKTSGWGKVWTGTTMLFGSSWSLEIELNFCLCNFLSSSFDLDYPPAFVWIDEDASLIQAPVGEIEVHLTSWESMDLFLKWDQGIPRRDLSLRVALRKLVMLRFSCILLCQQWLQPTMLPRREAVWGGGSLGLVNRNILWI